MEELLNAFGGTAFWPVVVIALPLLLGGLWLRRRGRRRVQALARVRERSIRDVSAGEVLFTGRYTALDEGRALVEEGEGRVVIERGAGAEAADGEVVWVAGMAVRQVDDPRPSGYRGAARIWLVDARGAGALFQPGADGLARTLRRARRLGTLGALLFAAGVAVAVASSVIAWRAARDADDAAPYADRIY